MSAAQTCKLESFVGFATLPMACLLIMVWTIGAAYFSPFINEKLKFYNANG